MTLLKESVGIILSAGIVLSVAASSFATGYAQTALPEKYSSVEQGYITPVKNQKSYGTCWAHGVVAACEASLIKNNGYPTDIDLSEFHLAYAAKHVMYDRLGLFNQGDDDFTQKYMEDGGDPEQASVTLACWNGLVYDSAHFEQFSSKKFDHAGLDHLDFASKELLYCMDAAHLTDYYVVNTDDIPKVKEYVMKYGAGTISLSSDMSYLDVEKGVWFYNEDSYLEQASWHLMCIVGWDDTIPAQDLSVKGNTPSQDGAFIVKNSWGTDSGNDGYYYIPYEKFMLEESSSYFFSFDSSDRYTYNYGYDDSQIIENYYDDDSPNTVSAGNIFTAVADDEKLEAVSFFPRNDSQSYEIKIYTDLPEAPESPEDGTLRLTVNGETKQSGYRTVRLPQTIDLSSGERYSVVISIHTEGDDKAAFALNSTSVLKTKYSDSDISWIKSSSQGWQNVTEIDEYHNIARIKAFTTSESAPIMNEPDDYNSYNGITKEELLEEADDLYNEYNSIINEYGINYNEEDLSAILDYSFMLSCFKQYSEMYTASEIYATLNNFKKALSEIRTVEPYVFLFDFGSAGYKILIDESLYSDIPQYNAYADMYYKIEEKVKNRELTYSNFEELRNSFADSFFEMYYYFIEHGYNSSNLQLMGDVNNDGIVSISDVTCIQRKLAGYEEKYPFENMTSDVDNDEEITLQDAVLIQKNIAGLTDFLPFYDTDFGIEDEYNADMPKEELISYLQAELDKRSAWDEYIPKTYNPTETFKSYVIYNSTKEFLKTADTKTNKLILFRTRNLINNVDTEMFY